ncbi:MAG: hypothetical protein ACI9P5_004448 [Saprospiraceae bacterium]|jgi:hypothetical protein
MSPAGGPIICNYNYNSSQGNPFGMDSIACTPCGATGPSVLDCSEFCNPILADSGKGYYIMIDNYQSTPTTLDFKWTGTALITCDSNFITSVTNPIKESRNILISPNPSNGILHINSSVAFNSDIIKIMSIDGKVIQNITLNGPSPSVDIHDQANGIYLYQVISKGSLISRGKIILKK